MNNNGKCKGKWIYNKYLQSGCCKKKYKWMNISYCKSNK